MKRIKRPRVGIKYLPWLLSGAVLTALTLVFPRVGILEWITAVPMLIGVYKLSADPDVGGWRAYRLGFLSVFAYYFVLYHWFVSLYPLDFVGLGNAASIAVVLAGWLGLPFLQAVPGGLIFLLFRLIYRSRMCDRFPLFRPFAFASLWVIFEWSSTLSWVGVPWGRLCLGQIIFLPILQSSSVFGSYFVTFLLLAVNGLVAHAVLFRPKASLCGGIAIALFLSNLGFGALRLSLLDRTGDAPIRVGVIQGNINSHDKWGSESKRLTMEAYRDLTRQAVREGAEFVLWPETVFPYILDKHPEISSFASQLAKQESVTVVFGVLHLDEEGKEYNILCMVDPDGTMHEETYAKRHLVPFGEYVPMREFVSTLIPPLANLSALDTELTPGEDSRLFDSKWGKIGALICFDSIYEQLLTDSVRDGAGLILLSSNDSWFLDSAAVYQHHAQAQIRAIESGRYIVRSANTGISSVIRPDGSTMGTVAPLIQGQLTETVYARTSRTLYSVIGNLFVGLCIAYLTGLAIFAVVYSKKSANHPVGMRSYYGKKSSRHES